MEGTLPMKKIVSLLLCVLLLGAMSTALADTVVTVKPGDVLTLDVSLTSASGLLAKIGIVVGDGAPVTFVDAVGVVGDGANDTVPPQSFDDYFDIVNINDVTLSADGTVLSGDLTDYTLADSLVTGQIGTLTFAVNDDATPGTYQVSTKVIIGSCTVDGTITFTVEEASDRVPGDVNDDGVVDMRDSVLLDRYLAEWDVTINMSNADVTGDGVVDMRDSVLLDRYLAEWDVTLQ